MSVTESRIAVIGGGRMGEAIVAGLLAAGVVTADSIVVADPSAEESTRTSLHPCAQVQTVTISGLASSV